MNQASRFSASPSCASSRSPSVGRPAIERHPQIDGFPHLDALLELRLLQLHADALLQRIHVAKRIETENGDGAAIRLAQPFDTLHRRRLAGAVRARSRPKISPSWTSNDTSSTADVAPYDLRKSETRIGGVRGHGCRSIQPR